MDRSIKLYVKKHVHKFLVHDNNLGSDKIEIRKNSRYWYVFYPSLTKVSIDEGSTIDDIPDWYFSSTSTINVTTTFDFNQEIVDDCTLVEIANILEESFTEALHHFVVGRVDAKKSIKESVLRFFAIYSIDEQDLQLSTALKSLQRLKNNHKKDLIRKKTQSTNQMRSQIENKKVSSFC